MGRYCGGIGFGLQQVETRPDIWEDVMVERTYYGDVISNRRNFQNSTNLNDDINVSNQISIIADSYVLSNFQSIKYVKFMGSKWKVTTIDIQHPRLILTLGGLYNENEA